MFLAETFKDENKLVEITDSKVLAHVNSLIPNFVQVGNAANNVTQAAKAGGEVLYKAIIPSGARLTNSKSMSGAVRGFYRGENGIKGHANLVAVNAQKGPAVVSNVASSAMSVGAMIVGQYYMPQINAELGEIKEGVSKIKSFQDNEFRSRVFSLIAHVKKIANFQVEILENDELRLSKIAQLDSLEEECTQLLGQANLTLNDFAKKTDIDYKNYKKELTEAHNWYMYQESLLDVLYSISDLRYTLNLGAVSRNQCEALLPAYTKQVKDTLESLTGWHSEMTDKLKIDYKEAKRKRTRLDAVVHLVPGLINDKFKYRAIEDDIAKKIETQSTGHIDEHKLNATDYYLEDIQVVSKNGKLYYLPTSDK